MDPKGKILIVDDDTDFVKTTEMILKSGGYAVAVATDAKKGLDTIREIRPDLVVLDIMMESIFEGFSFLSTLRTSPEFEQFKYTPVLMVSSVKNDTGSRFMFEDEGDMGAISQPDDFMDKPLKPNALLGKVAALMRKPH
jgi:DNA-binding response OmpR family regulator